MSTVHSFWCTLKGRNLTSCFYKWKEKDLFLLKSTIENSWNPKLSAYVLYGLLVYISELCQRRASQILKSASEKPIYTLLITKVDFFILHKLVPSEVSQIPRNCSSRWLCWDQIQVLWNSSMCSLLRNHLSSPLVFGVWVKSLAI